MSCLLADITWRPAFSDPNPLAWCITAAHFLACWLCFSAGRSQLAERDCCGNSSLTRFWYLLAMSMCALGLNKQLDLQTLLTQFCRDAARSGGWYGQRRTYQAAFVYGCAFVCTACAAASLYVVRGRWRQRGLAYLGIVFLLTFVVIRAASFHHVDRFFYGLPRVGNWMNASLELGGSLLVNLGAYRMLAMQPFSDEEQANSARRLLASTEIRSRK